MHYVAFPITTTTKQSITLIASLTIRINKIMPKQNKISAYDILNWHGSDHDIDELAEVMADIINGDYSIELAKEDIGDYQD